MNIQSFASFARRTLVSGVLAATALAGTLGYASIASADERVIVTAPRPVVEVVRPAPVVEEVVGGPVVYGPRVRFEPGFRYGYGYGVYGRPGFYGYRGPVVRGGFRR